MPCPARTTNSERAHRVAVPVVPRPSRPNRRERAHEQRPGHDAADDPSHGLVWHTTPSRHGPRLSRGAGTLTNFVQPTIRTHDAMQQRALQSDGRAVAAGGEPFNPCWNLDEPVGRRRSWKHSRPTETPVGVVPMWDPPGYFTGPTVWRLSSVSPIAFGFLAGPVVQCGAEAGGLAPSVVAEETEVVTIWLFRTCSDVDPTGDLGSQVGH